MYTVYAVYTFYTDPKTVMGSEFDQETAEKIAPPFIARLELANCIWICLSRYMDVSKLIHVFSALCQFKQSCSLTTMSPSTIIAM